MKLESDAPRGSLRGDSGPRPRQTRRVARAVIAAIALLEGGRLHAQTLPLPVLPPELPSTLVETESFETQRWEYAVGLAAGYDSNVDFVPEPSGDAVGTPLVSLVRVFPSPKGQLRIQGSGRAFMYADQGTKSHVDGDVGFQGTRSLSPTSNLAAGISAGVAHTSNYTILDEQGILLPLTRTRILQGFADWDLRLGTRSTVRVGGLTYYTDFEAPELVDSNSLRASLTLDRRLGERNTLFAYYAFDYSRLASPYSTHYGSLQWSLVLPTRSALLLEGGISHTARAAASGLNSSRNFYGGAAFVRQVGRSRIVLFARREVLPAFGLGRLRLADRLGMRATSPIGRAWQLDLAARHVRCSDSCVSSEGNDNELSDEATVALGRSVGTRYVVAGQVRYRRRGPSGTIPAIEGLQAALVLTFSNPRSGDLWVWTASPLFGPARLTN